MIGPGWQVIESSSGRDATPTLIAKATAHPEGGGRFRQARRAERERAAGRERLIESVRAAFRALPAQARPRRRVRI